jgi:[glutamine synthetase] adenylyltransferase / [glutamine synthetase]-adenylyl-L-tyrosine phosphorylase
MTASLAAPLAALLDQRLERLREAGLATADPAQARDLQQLVIASDYAFEQLRRNPSLFDTLRDPPPRLELAATDEAGWALQLRRFRHRHSLAIIAADVLDDAPLERTLAASSALAEHCIETALAAAETALATRHGWPRSADGSAQRLVVLALGKLGGAELNFSSDIDLVFAFAESGTTDGPRPLDHEGWFQRLGQRLIQLLGEVGAEGFGFRVDMRLRPFGGAGRLALSFSAMEQYYQSEGRDWERYAWIKARPVAGDIDAGNALLATLRPFIYRRYLDYTAFEGMREMKAMIEAEVQRRDMAGHLKLGPGGIREIEFIVQLQQLIRGGREPALRGSSLLPQLHALAAAGHLQPRSASRLEAAYRYLRRLENRLQMLRDEQVHTLPEDALNQARLAHGLGHADWSALQAALDGHRKVVREEFARVFEARRHAAPVRHPVFDAYWRRIDHDAAAAELTDVGVADAPALHEQLLAFARGAGVQGLAVAARARLDRVLPALLAAAVDSLHPRETLRRLLQLVHAVLRRSSYLALLDEQPVALQRLVEVTANSALLAERLAAHPLLLDDLLDPRAEPTEPDRESIAAEIRQAVAAQGGDTEATLIALAETRQSVAFRIGQAALFNRQSAAACARQLAELADAVLGALLPVAIADLERQHGRLPGAPACAGLAVIGYGSLGGEELGFASDLDLVFLFDEAIDGDSDGERPLDSTRYRLRAVQKLLALLSTLTPAGRLYEVDLRLRPDGAKGLLLTGLRSFVDYQRERAWTWEHQALVRARFIAGDPALAARFEAVRREVLLRPREPAALRRDVATMRARMRAELDRTDAASFDLKQGRGGLVDLEFLLQAGVLEHASGHPQLLASGRTPALLDALTEAGRLSIERGAALHAAHAALLSRALACSLDGRSRRVSVDDGIASARDAVIEAWQAAGLVDAVVGS